MFTNVLYLGNKDQKFTKLQYYWKWYYFFKKQHTGKLFVKRVVPIFTPIWKACEYQFIMSSRAGILNFDRILDLPIEFKIFLNIQIEPTRIKS